MIVDNDFMVWCIVAIDEEGTEAPRRFFASQIAARDELLTIWDTLKELKPRYAIKETSEDKLVVRELDGYLTLQAPISTFTATSEGKKIELHVKSLSLVDVLNLVLNGQRAITPMEYITKFI